MGVFSAALGFSCEDCHTASSNDWANYAKDASPRKTDGPADGDHDAGHQQAVLRRPPGRHLLHAAIAAATGRRSPPASTSSTARRRPTSSTCSCRRPRRAARRRCRFSTSTSQAVGGAQRAATLTSLRREGHVLRLRAGRRLRGRSRSTPRRRTRRRSRVVDPEAGDNITTFNGTAGWVSAPFKPIDVLELHGAELDSARADAELLFPANIKTMLTGMRTSNDFINDRTRARRPGQQGHRHRHPLLRRGDGAADARRSARRRRRSAGCRSGSTTRTTATSTV